MSGVAKESALCPGIHRVARRTGGPPRSGCRSPRAIADGGDSVDSARKRHCRNVVLVLVVWVVAAAATGDRPAGVLAAVSAGAWFDFFLTEPYLRFTIADADDIKSGPPGGDQPRGQRNRPVGLPATEARCPALRLPRRSPRRRARRRRRQHAHSRRGRRRWPVRSATCSPRTTADTSRDGCATPALPSSTTMAC